ncbi:hypothetical protein D3C76_1734710 [compost metagenome]
MDPFRKIADLVADGSFGYGMGGVALHLDNPAVLLMDQKPALIGAVQGTDGGKHAVFGNSGSCHGCLSLLNLVIWSDRIFPQL